MKRCIKMKSIFGVLFALFIFVNEYSISGQGNYPIQPVPFTSVKVTDNFWAPKIKINHEVTIPIAIEQSTISGRIKNFEIAAGEQEGQFCSEYPFDDTDIYKIIEAASYSIQTYPDKELEAYLDTLIEKVANAQEEDGYLYTIRTIQGDDSHEWIGKRWEKVHLLSHELYNSGHMFEAATAHYLATGKRNFLDVAIKNADLIDSTFGWGKLENYPGHQEVEVGLVKLYNVTGEKRYLDLAKFFLNVRGPDGDKYNQSHKKVIEQTKAVGHAVRATYMYSAMADIAALFNDESYIRASRAIWEDIVQKKLYITGGIGATGSGEAFGEDYQLPNMSAYCETCAAIGNVMWNYRMFLYDGDAKYYDVLERTLYNGLISGVSLAGDRFFYPNPLESMGQHKRRKWFGCACCPPNIARLLPSVPGYIYAKTTNDIYVNLFIDNTAQIKLGEQNIGIIQETNYPWSGEITIHVNPEDKSKFALHIRIPGWARNEAVPSDLYTFINQPERAVIVTLNGEEVQYDKKSGFAVIDHSWKKGDVVEIKLPMNPLKIKAHEKVEADYEKIAVQRGPFVYTAEWPDTEDGKILSLVFNKDQELQVKEKKELLNGVHIIKAKARLARAQLDGSVELSDNIDITLIPYYAWNNRGPGEMMVWLPTREKSMRPLPSPTIASTSQVSASKGSGVLFAVNDQLLPQESKDRTWPFYHWWPKNDTTEWIQYDFNESKTISASEVYWYDDGPYGGCRIPAVWEIRYKSDGGWVPVKATSKYKIAKDKWNRIEFEPVTTTAVRLIVTLPKEHSAGVHEWEVK